MKRVWMIFLIMAIVIFSLGAAETTEHGSEAFINELAYHLRERGWDDAEIEQLQQQARLLQWEDARFADPAMVAYALHYGAHNSIDATKEIAMIRASAALEVAIESRELLRLGYSEQAVAQGAARGIRDVVAQARQQQSDERPSDTQIGEMIRNVVRSEVAKGHMSTSRNSIGTGIKAAVQAGQAGNPTVNRPSNAGGQHR